MKQCASPIMAEPSVQALEDRIEELEAALRARDDFIATVGHELKNPLTPLLLQAQYLTHKLGGSPDSPLPDRGLVLGKLHGFVARLQQFLGTLDRILDVSRINSGQLDMVRETLNFADVVRGAAEAMQREFDVADVALHLDLQPVTGNWDRMRLEQVCLNLLSNAMRYGLANPVRVRLRVVQGWAELTVTDQGQGIDPVDQATIFERFDRGSAGASHTGGLGVGLWIVKKICGALGGEIGVRSRLGQGSTFTVRLPCYPRENS